MTLAGLSVFSQDMILTHPELKETFGPNGIFWALLSYSSALGSSLLSIGTIAGFSLMRMEGVTLRWYIRHFTGKIFLGWLSGLAVFYIAVEYLYH